MGLIPAAVERLAAEFGRLPGIGPKTAQRLTFHCMARDAGEHRAPRRRAARPPRGRATVHAAASSSPRASSAPSAPTRSRDQTVMCVVEEPLDVLAVERSGEFGGVYHVLGGALSPDRRRRSRPAHHRRPGAPARRG